MPTAPAASLTSRRTASATAAPPATRSNAAAWPAATRARSCSVVASCPRGDAHRHPRVRPLGEEAQRRREVVDLPVADPDPERDAVRKLREPADVAHDERLAERERPDRRPARLAHRRRAEADVDVAGGHQRPEPTLVDEPLAHDPVAAEPEALEPAVEVEARRRRADEQEPRIGMVDADAGERLEELRHALRLVDVPERPEERPARDVRGGDVRHRPRRVRHPGDRAVEPGATRVLLDVARVDDRAPWRARAPRPSAGSPPAAPPRAAAAACRGRRGRAGGRRRRDSRSIASR